jgi:hypothetical protein
MPARIRLQHAALTRTRGRCVQVFLKVIKNRAYFRRFRVQYRRRRGMCNRPACLTHSPLRLALHDDSETSETRCP